MGMKAYPVIDLIATGNNIRRLRMERGLTVRELQSYFGFEEPRAIYKWQKGESLPTVDNLYALGVRFMLSPAAHIIFSPAVLDTASVRCSFHHLLRLHCLLRDRSHVQLRTRKRSAFDRN